MHYTKVILEESILLAQRVAYNANGYEEYIGWSPPTAAETEESWVIHKLEYDSSNRFTARKFAGGSKNFDKAWSKRATYDYV